MSSTAKKIALILGALVLLVTGFAFVTVMDKMKLEQDNANLQDSLIQTQDREQKGQIEIKKLKKEVADSQQDASKLKTKLSKTEKQAEDLMDQVDNIKKDRDKFKDRVDNIKKERDGLMSKVQNLVKKNESLQEDLQRARSMQEEMEAEPVPTPQPKTRSTARQTSIPVTADDGDEAYWAQLLKDKASLEIKISELEEELSQNSLEIVELTQAKTELEIELDTVQHDREELERNIAHQEGLINNLSLELARTKNDKKFVSDRAKKVTDENKELRKQLKMLASTKGALEKSIVRLTKDKDKIESQLGQSEIIVQSKIDEIWDIKDSLDKAFKTSTTGVEPSSDVELPPIVVSSNGQGASYNTGISHPGLNGKVVSINEDNNFLIVNIGEDSGVRVGDKLSVYRDTKYLASLEVIQVRKDIAAADIKDQWTKIQVGDLVQ